MRPLSDDGAPLPSCPPRGFWLVGRILEKDPLATAVRPLG
jgi:hypothetical protein